MIWTRAGHEFIAWSIPNDPNSWDRAMDRETIMVRDVQRGDLDRIVAYRLGTADEQVLVQVWQALEYDLSHLAKWGPIKGLYNHIAASGLHPLIIDGGAHIGLASVWFALEFPLAEVIAVEPEAENFKLLARNTAGLHVQCVHGALGDSYGLSRIVDPGEGTWGYQTEPTSVIAGSVVRTPIADMIGVPGRLFIVKLDIEGAEGEVMRTHADWLKECPIVIVEPHSWINQDLLAPLYEGRGIYQCGENVVSIRGDL
jgi:FkbM family methyltransferase